MNEQLKAVANRLKGLREMMNISQIDMAKHTNLSLAEYQSCESGKIDLSFTFLSDCAKFLGVDISELVEGQEPHLTAYMLCRKHKGMPIKRREDFYYHHLASMMKGRLAEPFYVKVRYSEDKLNEPIKLDRHGGQEFDFIVKGSLKIQIGDEQEILQKGDCIYYNGSQPHGMIAIDGKDCEFLAVVVKGDAGDMDDPAEQATPVMMKTDSELLYKKFVKETLNRDGHLEKIDFIIPEYFNFGYDVIDELAQKIPKKTAMIWESNDHTERIFSFKDISERSNQIANYLKSININKGDRVMLIMKRHHQFWPTIVALHKIGAIAIPATNQLVAKDLEYRFIAAGVKAIVCTADGELTQFVDEVQPKCSALQTKIIVNGYKDGWLNLDDGADLHSNVFNRPTGDEATCSSDPMLMYFTSGTSGYPKIATHDFTYPLGHIVTARWWHNVDPEGLHFSISDTGWAKAAWGKIYGQWLCEAPMFVYDFDRFHADDILQMFAKHHITTFCAPPTMYRMFIKEDLSKYNLSSLNNMCIAGEALNPEVYNQIKNATGLRIMEGFGQTETTLVIGNLIGMVPRPGSMGKPNPQYDVVLIGSDDEEVPVGDVGEICLKTDNGRPCGMFMGYYRDDKQTGIVWNNDYYHTGDMAWRDEAGYFWYVGRKDDVIKSSGYRIGPFEIESVLMEIPYVLECAVTGVPDTVRGQIVKATIVLTKGTEPTEELKKEIQNYVKEHTAPYKYPRAVEFVSELPKTVSGKIRRAEIRKQSDKK